MFYVLNFNGLEILRSLDLAKIYSELDLILKTDFKTSYQHIQDNVYSNPISAGCTFKCEKFNTDKRPCKFARV